MPTTYVQFDRLAAAYVECEIFGENLAAFYCHVSECEECRAYLYRYRMIVYLLKRERQWE